MKTIKETPTAAIKWWWSKFTNAGIKGKFLYLLLAYVVVTTPFALVGAIQEEQTQPDQASIQASKPESTKKLRKLNSEMEGKYYLDYYKDAKELGLPIDYYEEQMDMSAYVSTIGLKACEAMIGGSSIHEVNAAYELSVKDNLPYEDKKKVDDQVGLAKLAVSEAAKNLCPEVDAE